MNSVLTMRGARQHLRVAIVSSDPLRRSALAATVVESGHQVTEDISEAEVVLADGSAPHPPHSAVVSLGNLDAAAEAAGLLPQDATAAQIGAAIQALAVGLSVRVRDVTAEQLARAVEPTLQVLLTPRELEVLGALVRGLSNKAVARKLDISQHTVKFHVEALFRKLGVRSRSQAVIRGLAFMARTRLDV
jgi:two-component system, NarL family, nitrate/nitrite response regulator NarL